MYEKTSKYEFVPSKVVMTGPFDDQPHIMLSCELHSSLYMLRSRCIDNINGVTLAAAGCSSNRKTRIVVEVIPSATDWVILVKEYALPFFLNSRACCRIVCRLTRMTHRSRGRRLK